MSNKPLDGWKEDGHAPTDLTGLAKWLESRGQSEAAKMLTALGFELLGLRAKAAG